MKNILRVSINISMLFLIACLPSLFKTQHFSLANYIIAVKETALAIFNPADIVFVNQRSGTAYNLFPFILEPWFNTLTILVSAIFLSLLLSLVLMFLMYRYQWAEKIIYAVNNCLSIIPDIFYIPISITIVILIYQYTGMLLFEIATSQSSNAVVFPVLVLLIIPTVNSVTLLYELMKNEKKNMYVEFAISKGLSDFEVFRRHILNNLMLGYLINLKQLIWITLSSLLFLERIMNIFGVSVFIFDYNSPIVLFITFMMIYIPIALLFSAAGYIVNRMTGRRMAE